MRRTSLSDDSLVELTSSVDVTKLELQADEAFLVSRLSGRKQTVAEIVSIAGMPAVQARSTLERLVLKGAVIVRDLRGPKIDDGDYENFLFPVSAMSEPTDLNDAQKKRILFVEANIGEWNHYALLGLKRTASSTDVKGAFRAASKEFHPDAYFRKELGSFRGRIDKIFRVMKQASDVLADTEKRAKYDAEVVTGFTPEEMRELDRLATEHKAARASEDRDKRVAERLKERRIGRNPMMERIQKSRDFLKLANESMAAGKHMEAARHAKLAAEYAPQDAALQTKVQEIVANANRERALHIVKKIDTFLSTQEKPALETLGEELAGLAPKDPVVLTGAARLLRASGRRTRAMRIAQQATALAPKNVDALSILFEIAADEKNWNTAVRAAEALHAVDGKNATYKEWLRIAKRNV